jgi:ABC-2 type transport system permease protein
MLGRILHLLLKEFLQFKRDRSAWFRLIVPPIIQMLLFGYAATFDVWNVSTAILDQDHSQVSRELVASVVHSGRFEVTATPQAIRDLRQAIESSDAQLGLVIPPGFAEQLRKGQSTPLQVLIDGTNSNTALIALGYLSQIVGKFGDSYKAELQQHTSGLRGGEPVTIQMQERYWYNPNLNGRWFFVPGVIGTLTLVTIVNLTAFAIVREREVGTLEQIMVTPIRPIEFILGKTMPFFLIGLLEVSIAAAVGKFWFQVPFKGDLLVLFCGTCLFLMSVLAIGLLISTICTTQQQAFASNFFVLNPLFILSGFSFPISSMPQGLQWFTMIDPLRYYLVIIRATYLKGVGFEVLWPQMAALATITLTLLTIAVMRFHKSLD